MQVKNDFPLRDSLWYKIGGTTKYFIICENPQDIKEALEFIKQKNIQKVFILGLGSNLIFTDEYFEGAVVYIAAPKQSSIKLTEDGLIESFAGEILDDVINVAFENNLVGLEWAGGLPGTVGAAVRGNVGAFGGEIKDNIEKVDIIDYSTGKPVLKTLTNQELQFAYRESVVKKQGKMIVVTAYFKLDKADKEAIEKAKEVYSKNKQFRKDRHPLEYPNCGSVFKNIRDKEKIEKILSVYPDLRENVEKKWYGKIAVASLIEKLGLKGFRIGDAQISEKHALFIINLGHAKSLEVRQIIDTIQQKFQETFGFNLEVEVEIVS